MEPPKSGCKGAEIPFASPGIGTTKDSKAWLLSNNCKRLLDATNIQSLTVWIGILTPDIDDGRKKKHWTE